MRLAIIATLTAWAVLPLAGPLRAQQPYFAPPEAMAPPGAPPGQMPWTTPGAYGMGMYPGEGSFGPGPDSSGDEPSLDPARDPAADQIWSFELEGMLLTRSTAKSQTLVRLGAFDINGAPLLSTDNLKFDLEFVPRFNIVLHQPSGWDITFAYFESNNWESSQTVVAETDISVSAPNILLDNLNAARFTYESDLWSAEIGLQYRVTPRLKLFGGLRFMELTEHLFQEDNFPNLDILFPSYAIRVNNRLMGVQAGVAGTLCSVASRLSLDAQLKGGYYNNEAKHVIHELADQSFVGGIIGAETSDTSTVMEFKMNATLRVNDHIKAWLGYNLLWMVGVATAPSQLGGNDVYGIPFAGARIGQPGALSVDTFDSLFFYGVNAGFEVSY